MKTKLKYIFVGILALSLCVTAYYYTNGRQFGGFATWYLSSSNLRPSVSTWGVQIPSISGSTQCLQVGSTGIISGTGSACGSGGGGYAEFTQVGSNQQNVSSTPFLFVNGLQASSTILFDRATITDSFSATKFALAGDYLTSFSSDPTIAVTSGALQCVDVTCTDCLNATEIEDLYLLLAGDTSAGDYTMTGNWNISSLTSTNHTTTNDLVLGSTYIDDWYGSARLRFQDNDGLNSDFVMTVAGGGFGTQVFAGADGTLTSPTGADLSQILGGLYFYGYANTGYKNAAQILGGVRDQGSVSDTSMPGSIGIYTSQNNSVSPSLQLDISSLGVTSSPKFIVGRTGYTTTSTIVLGNTSAAGQGGGCIAIEDNDDSGYTYCTANNGVLTCSTTSCE